MKSLERHMSEDEKKPKQQNWFGVLDDYREVIEVSHLSSNQNANKCESF